MTRDNPAEPGINLVYRIAVAGGLRNLASLIERRMDLPVPMRVEIHYPVIGDTDDAERAEIDRIAAILGETPEYQYNGHHYTVTHEMGPVAYVATAITREYMARHNAETAAARRYRRETWGE
ncbi:hypothetical protein [Actinomadura harenae]|uniref:Uncharacterized protein n=1 Tax=Actinomadura harenae TaxID=2483351 RepID=A0A3M2LNL0_9ACTN|nr:hypothetical protein [Actinomadura harenae]RMI39054.1 hypothetical protein EBO15_30795 [Actinomadura harenae]